MRPNLPRILLMLLVLFALSLRAVAAEVIPPSPAEYFNDYADVVDPSAAQQLNTTLKNFERDTTNQVVVAIFPKMQTDSDMADYCTRIFQSWHVGQKGRNNGVVLFVFIQDRKMQIITGYGMEGALPDATCKDIIDNEIKPFFKQEQYADGIRAGVTAILAATRGEYHALAQPSSNFTVLLPCLFFAIIIGYFILVSVLALKYRRHRGVTYRGSSSSNYSSGSSFSSSSSSDSDFSGGGFSGGGFSGGGGSTGGGGAGGSW